MTARILALLLVSSATLADTWHLGGPGGGGWIQSIAYSPHDPQTIYVGCDVGGFYRSTDGGQHWRILNRGLQDMYVEQIVPHPTNPKILYLGTNSGVHRSDDGGETWRLLREGFPPLERYRYSAPIAALVLDPAQPDTLYATIGVPRDRRGGQGRIYRTTDGGAHWALLTPDGALPKDALPVSLLLRPGGGLLISTQYGIYESRDDGKTWTERNTGLPNHRTRYLGASAADPKVLYVTVDATPGVEPWDGGVWRSDDGAASWKRVVGGLSTYLRKGSGERNLTSQYDHLVVDPADPKTVWLGGAAWVNAAVYRTTDGGESWQRLTFHKGEKTPNLDQGYIGWGPTPMCMALHPQDHGRLIFGTSGAVEETCDHGATWVPRHTRAVGDAWAGTGLEVTCLWTMACHPTERGHWLLGYMDIGLWQTRDGGATLKPTMTGVAPKHQSTGMAFAYDPANPHRLWGGFCQWGSNDGGLYASDDDGASWQPVAGLPAAQIHKLVVDPTSPAGQRRLWVLVRDHGLYEGTPATGTWTLLSAGLPGPRVTDFLARPDGSLLAVVAGSREEAGAVYRFAAGRWSLVATAPRFGDPRRIVAAPSDPTRIYLADRARRVGTIDYPGGLYASRDGGKTFAKAFADHFVNAVAVHPTNPDLVVLGGTDHPYHDAPMGCGVRLSRDGGGTWTDITDDLTMPNVSWLGFEPADPTRLLVGTGGNSFFWRTVP